jgi:hypothetical protein
LSPATLKRCISRHRGDLWQEDVPRVTEFLRSWERLIAAACSTADTLTLIEARVNYLRAKGGT